MIGTEGSGLYQGRGQHHPALTQNHQRDITMAPNGHGLHLQATTQGDTTQTQIPAITNAPNRDQDLHPRTHRPEETIIIQLHPHQQENGQDLDPNHLNNNTMKRNQTLKVRMKKWRHHHKSQLSECLYP